MILKRDCCTNARCPSCMASKQATTSRRSPIAIRVFGFEVVFYKEWGHDMNEPDEQTSDGNNND